MERREDSRLMMASYSLMEQIHSTEEEELMKEYREMEPYEMNRMDQPFHSNDNFHSDTIEEGREIDGMVEGLVVDEKGVLHVDELRKYEEEEQMSDGRDVLLLE